MSRLTVSALRATVAVDFDEAMPVALIERVREAWSGALAGADAVPDRVLECVDQQDDERLLEQLSTRVTLAALEHERGNAVLLHACGVALPDGRVIAFVGPSGRGKTTLSRALALQYGYVSDESIAIDADLRVHPYRKPLSVVRPNAPKEQVSPRTAGLRELPAVPLTLAAVVLIERDDALAAPVVEHLHFADAVTPLVAQASYLGDLPGTIVTLARVCERIGGIRRVRYSDAASVADVIEELLASGPAPEAWDGRSLAVVGTDGELTSADAVDFGDVMFVLSGRLLRRVEGIATAVLRAVDDGELESDATVRRVLDEVGPPPQGDAAELISDVLGDLARAGFVVPSPAA